MKSAERISALYGSASHRLVRSSLSLHGTAFAVAKHRQRVIERRDVEDAIQVGARKHLVDEMTWIH